MKIRAGLLEHTLFDFEQRIRPQRAHEMLGVLLVETVRVAHNERLLLIAEDLVIPIQAVLALGEPPQSIPDVPWQYLQSSPQRQCTEITNDIANTTTLCHQNHKEPKS